MLGDRLVVCEALEGVGMEVASDTGIGWNPRCSCEEGTVRGISDALEGSSEAAPEAVRQAVGGGCQSGWGRLLSVTNAMEAGTCRQGNSGWA